MNIFHQLYQLHSYKTDAFDDVLSFTIKNAKDDINECFYQDLTFTNSQIFLKPHSMADLILKRAKTTTDLMTELSEIDVLKTSPELVINRRPDNLNMLSLEDMKKYLDEQKITWTQQEGRPVGYQIFNYPSTNPENFHYVYDKIKHKLDKDYIKKEYAKFFIRLLQNEQLDLLTTLMADLDFDINHVFEDPLFFYAKTEKSIAYIMEHTPDFDLKDRNGKTYQQHWAVSTDGLQVLGFLDQHKKVNTEETLEQFLLNDKTITDLKPLWLKLAKEQKCDKAEVTVGGYNIFSQALRTKNFRFAKHIANNAKINYDALHVKGIHPLSILLSQSRGYRTQDPSGKIRKNLFETIFEQTNIEHLLADEKSTYVLAIATLRAELQFLSGYSETQTIKKLLATKLDCNDAVEPRIDSLISRISLTEKNVYNQTIVSYFYDYLDLSADDVLKAINRHFIFNSKTGAFAQTPANIALLYLKAEDTFTAQHKIDLVDNVIKALISIESEDLTKIYSFGNYPQKQTLYLIDLILTLDCPITSEQALIMTNHCKKTNHLKESSNTLLNIERLALSSNISTNNKSKINKI